MAGSARKKDDDTPRRQMDRRSYAKLVVRAMLDSVADGEMEAVAVGRVVARIIKNSGKYVTQPGPRHDEDVRQAWLQVLDAEWNARDIAAEREAKAAISRLKKRH